MLIKSCLNQWIKSPLVTPWVLLCWHSQHQARSASANQGRRERHVRTRCTRTPLRAAAARVRPTEMVPLRAGGRSLSTTAAKIAPFAARAVGQLTSAWVGESSETFGELDDSKGVLNERLAGKRGSCGFLLDMIWIAETWSDIWHISHIFLRHWRFPQIIPFIIFIVGVSMKQTIQLLGYPYF